jgi:hypothetical protein
MAWRSGIERRSCELDKLLVYLNYRKMGTPLILTRFQPGDFEQQEYRLTVSTVYLWPENQKPLKRLENQKGSSVTRLKPGENEMKTFFQWSKYMTSYLVHGFFRWGYFYLQEA